MDGVSLQKEYVRVKNLRVGIREEAYKEEKQSEGVHCKMGVVMKEFENIYCNDFIP